jgi:predicted RNase H-like nuclease (RuvC/YqgF family)
MLIGIHKTVAELEAIMEEKITANRMALREVEKEYSELQQDIRYNPPKRGQEDARPARNLELQKKITEYQNQSEWLAQKLEEAEKTEEKDHKVYLTLNDCLMLGITIKEEE